MFRKSRATATIVAVLMALGLTLNPSGLSPAQATPAPESFNDTRPVTSEPVEVDFAVQYLGVVADLAPGVTEADPQGAIPYGEARFRVQGEWTQWQPFNQDGAQGEGQFTSSLLLADNADAYQVRALPTWGVNWRAAAINTDRGAVGGVSEPVGDARAMSLAYVDNPTCRSRADWGADESIRKWTSGDPETYYPAQVLTVHHTAGSNDPSQDFAATVRAIYQYHVLTNGWSDIGYQYLIDANGIVYEGRTSGPASQSCFYGGDGSDFGHQSGTDYVVTGAHVGGYNSGNLGISLMGCFEPGQCTGNTTPTAAAIDALATQVSKLAQRHGLNPTGTTTYVNPVGVASLKVPVLGAHRDWNATACPGASLYAQLAQVRQTAAARMARVVFTDVPVGTQFFDEITWLYDNGYSTGWLEANGTRTYRPLNSINRDAMAAFMYRFAGSPNFTPPAQSPFTDLTPNDQFYKEITWLNAMGYSTGWVEADGSRTFRPVTPINRDAMAAFMYRYAGSPQVPSGTNRFTDVTPTSTEFYDEIMWLANSGISTGWPEANGTYSFRPGQPVARDAMAAFIYRLNDTLG